MRHSEIAWRSRATLKVQATPHCHERLYRFSTSRGHRARKIGGSSKHSEIACKRGCDSQQSGSWVQSQSSSCRQVGQPLAPRYGGRCLTIRSSRLAPALGRSEPCGYCLSAAQCLHERLNSNVRPSKTPCHLHAASNACAVSAEPKVPVAVLARRVKPSALSRGPKLLCSVAHLEGLSSNSSAVRASRRDSAA